MRYVASVLFVLFVGVSAWGAPPEGWPMSITSPVVETGNGSHPWGLAAGTVLPWSDLQGGYYVHEWVRNGVFDTYYDMSVVPDGEGMGFTAWFDLFEEEDGVETFYWGDSTYGTAVEGGLFEWGSAWVSGGSWGSPVPEPGSLAFFLLSPLICSRLSGRVWGRPSLSMSCTRPQWV